MTGAEHIRRLDALKALRRPLESFWREAYQYTFPLRGEKIGSDSLPADAVRAASSATMARIYDSTCRDSAKLLAANIMGGMTPANSKWVALDINNIDDDEGKEWLDTSSRTVWRNIHASNYDIAGYEGLIDLTVSGQIALYITEGPKDSGQPYNFQQWPLHSLYLADSTGKGAVDTVYRVFSLTAEQAVSEYGEKEVSEQIRKAAEKKPDTLFEFVQAIYPRKNPGKLELPIASDHIEVKGKKILRESGYEEMPVAVARWLVIPDSVYAVGPVDDALANTKTLNEVVKLVLSNADLAISGMWGAVDDGVLNPKAVKVGPRKVIPVANKDSFFPLTSGTKFDIAVLEIDRLQADIRKTLMTDQLQPQDGPAMTATEVHIRTQLIRQLLGPMYGRLQSEFLQTLVARCFGIALRADALGEPPESVANKIAIVRFTSPLANAQKLEDVGAMERFETGLFGEAQFVPEILDNYDTDKAVRRKSELLGVPADLLRDEKEVKVLREQRQAAMAQAEKTAQDHEMKKAIAPKMMGKGMM